MDTYIDCNDCKNISLTEAAQMDKKQPHMCMHYGIRVFHGTSEVIHASCLAPCKACKSDDFQEFRAAN